VVASKMFLRHAVGASEIAPVRDGDAQITQRPCLSVQQRHDSLERFRVLEPISKGSWLEHCTFQHGEALGEPMEAHASR